MAAKYHVRSYFINVDAGDSAIHALIQETNPNTIVSLVLIDGGYARKVPRIRAILKEIQAEFKVGALTFDAIVVTHWDGDHWEGISSMILKDIFPQLQVGATQNKIQCSFMNYGTKSTKFYCPEDISNGLPPDTGFTALEGGTKLGLDFSNLPEKSRLYKQVDAKGITLKTTEPVCDLVLGPAAIGYDLFMGTSSPSSSMSTIEDAYKTRPDLKGDKPILLCVGVQRTFAGLQNKDGIKKIFAHGKGNNSLSVVKNAASLMTVLLWPLGGLNDRKVSLYTGGDAGDPEENRLIAWLGNNKVSTVKAGHHGSDNGTSIQWGTMTVGQWIFSASGRAKSNHPSWATIGYLTAKYDGIEGQPLLAMYEPSVLRPAVEYDDLSMGFLIDKKKGGLSNDAVNYTSALLAVNKNAGDWLDEMIGYVKEVELPGADTDKAAINEAKRSAEAAFRRAFRTRWIIMGSPKDNSKRVTQYILVQSNPRGVDDTPGDLVCTLPLTEAVEQKVRLTGTKRDSTTANIGANDQNIRPLSRKADLQGAELEASNRSSKRALQAPKGQPPAEEAKDAIFASTRTGNLAVMQAVMADSPGSNLHSLILEEYINSFGDELPSTSSKPWTYPVPAMSPNPTWIWFKDALSAQAMTISGRSGDIQSSLTGIALTVGPSGASASTRWSLSFSTSQNAFKSQFGQQPSTSDGDFSFGISDLIPGQVLSLVVKGSTESPAVQDPTVPPTIRDLWNFLSMPTFPPWLLTVFGDVPLTLPKSPSRNFILYQPQVSEWTAIRIAMAVRQPEILTNLVTQHFDEIAVTNISVIGAKRAVHNDGVANQLMQSSASMYICTDANVTFTQPCSSALIIALHTNGYDIMLQFGQEGPSVSDLVSWLLNKIPDAAASGDGILPQLEIALKSVGNDVYVRELAISMDDDNHFADFRIDLEICLNFGAPDGQNAAIRATFSWQRGIFRFQGKIWDENLPVQSNPDLPTTDIPFALNPMRESFLELAPVTDNLNDYISLKYLRPDRAEITYPTWLPDEITDFTIDFELGDEVSFSCDCTIQCGPQPPSDIPPIWIDELSVGVDIEFSGKSMSDFELTASGSIDLYARDASLDVAELTIDVSYIDDTWSISASADTIIFSHLYAFFDSGNQQDAVMNMMENLTIPYFSVQYSFGGSDATLLQLLGSVSIGPLDLDLEYTHKGVENGNTVWSVHASLSADSQAASTAGEVSLGDIIDDLTDDRASMPDFVANLAIPVEDIQLEIDCFKPDSAPNLVVFALVLTVDDFEFSLVQFQDHTSTDFANQSPTRLIRICMDKLPTIPSIPIIDQLEQPFDQLNFMWLSNGISRADVNILNTVAYAAPRSALVFKESSDNTKTSPSDIMGSPGCHFQVLLLDNTGPNVILDYAFNGPTKSSSPDPGSGAGTNSNTSGDPPVTPNTTGGHYGNAAMAPMSRSFGPLTVTSIGLGFTSNTLSITLSATVMLGPIGFEMMGFAIDFSLADVETLSDLVQLSRLSFKLDGLAVQFSEPPVTIAGLFEHIHSDTLKGYAGGISIQVDPYDFMAAGAYELVKPAGSDETYKTVFAFAKLNGPLVELEFAEISGVTGGFGYNSSLQFPGVTQIPTFPFVSMSVGASSLPAPSGASGTVYAMDQLRALTDDNTTASWISPEEGSIWLAAGLEIKAFQALAVQAVFGVDLSPNPTFAIVAEAVATMPPDAETDDLFLLVDLGMTAVFQPTLGILQIQGQLTPRSFVLSSACKLSGGFALYYWFNGSEHAGDWVFTVGGYNSSFSPPDYYPIPPRLAINWQYDDSISISGDGYFAITPHVCMGGGRLDVIFESSHISACFTAWADFFIKYKPFYFTADVGINISGDYRISAFGITSDISFSIGADIELWGPPMAGKATVHVGPFNATVNFGPDVTAPPPLSFDDFYDLVRQSDSNTSGADDGNDQVLAATGGIVANPSSSAISLEAKVTDQWFVRAPTFEFQVQSYFPITQPLINGNPPDQVDTSAPWNDPLYFKPMESGAEWTSTLTITVLDTQSKSQVSGFSITPIVKNVPKALWGAYSETSASPTSTFASFLAGSDMSLASGQNPTISKVMGLIVQPEPPRLAPDNLPAFGKDGFGVFDVMDGTDFGDPEIKILPPNAPEFLGFRPTGSRKEALDDVRHYWDDDSVSKIRSAACTLYRYMFRGETLPTGKPSRFEGMMDQLWREAPSFTAGA